MTDATTGADADADSDSGTGATGRLLVGLVAVALFVTVLGIGVVWSLTYGPLG